MSTRDGGPAFPSVERIIAEGGCEYHQGPPGMTLRDYFAGQALIGYATSSLLIETFDVSDKIQAQRCYERADAMLEER